MRNFFNLPQAGFGAKGKRWSPRIGVPPAVQPRWRTVEETGKFTSYGLATNQPSGFVGLKQPAPTQERSGIWDRISRRSRRQPQPHARDKSATILGLPFEMLDALILGPYEFVPKLTLCETRSLASGRSSSSVFVFALS
jgi:hypothetical protein